MTVKDDKSELQERTEAVPPESGTLRASAAFPRHCRCRDPLAFILDCKKCFSLVFINKLMDSLFHKKSKDKTNCAYLIESYIVQREFTHISTMITLFTSL